MGHRSISAALFLAAVTLGGCASQGALTSLQPVCAALGAPIQYNSKRLTSAVHAGPKLAPVLAQRNHVGVNLHCPAYR